MNVPSDKRRQDTKSTTSPQQTGVGCASAAVVQVSESEHQECHVEGEEEQEEGHGGSQGADEHEEGEDEPAHEVDAERVEEGRGRFGFECLHDLESTGGQNDGGTDPEATVRRKSSCTEGVTGSDFPVDETLDRWNSLSSMNDRVNLPHAGKKLDETTVSESSTDDDVGVLESTGTQVNARQDESSQSESAQAERCRVGELPSLGGLVETGLEFTTEGRKTNGVPSVDMSKRVAAVVVRLALLRLHVGGVVVVIGVTVHRRLHRLLINLVLLLRGRHVCDELLSHSVLVMMMY